MKIILALILLTSPLAQASLYQKTTANECSPVDLRDRFHLEMRNQHEVSWCFAHAAADFLQFMNRIPEQISAADIAIRYSQTGISRFMQFFKGLINKENSRLPAQTGFIKIAFDRILSEGYCPESAFPSEEWIRVNETDASESKVEIRQAILDLYSIQKKIKSGLYLSPSQLPWHYRFKNIQKDQFFEILKNSTAANLMNRIRENACQNERRPFPQSKPKSEFFLKNRSTFKSIHSKLNQNEPVTIDFFSDILRNYTRPKRKIEDLHTVLLYGRKLSPETGQCEYLIKDSYGKQCSKYDPLIKCEDGYVWLTESKLFKSMTSHLQTK